MKKKGEGIKRTYYITRELEDKVRKIAYLERTTMSAIVRCALTQYELVKEKGNVE